MMESIEITAHFVSDEAAHTVQIARLYAQPVGGIVYLSTHVGGGERRGYLFDVDTNMSIWRLIEKAAAWAAEEYEK